MKKEYLTPLVREIQLTSKLICMSIDEYTGTPGEFDDDSD